MAPRRVMSSALRGPLAACTLAAACAGGAASGTPRRLSAVCNGPVGQPGCCQLQEGWAEGSAAWGDFEDTISSVGFASLRVFGREGVDDNTMAFAAGVVEGALTAPRTAQHLNTSLASEFGGYPALWQQAEQFLLENDAYVLDKIKAQAQDSPYWAQVALIYAQLDGILEGHRLAVAAGAQAAPMNRTGLLFINALVDLSSVVSKPFAGMRPGGLPEDPMEWTATEAAVVTDRETHCSAIVKVAADYSDLWTAHNTWTGFFTMLRAAKLYDLPLAGAAARKTSFPGYFGTLGSNDDLFVLSSGLAVQETTNPVYQPRKKLRTARSILTWARTVLANRMAKDGKSWTEWFAQENSGTVNNQWMVVDYNRFTPYKPLINGTLWVLEQLPGYVESADLTAYLRNGHWPSFNQPFFPEVRNLSGNDRMAARFGLQYSYDLNPRAKIFRRDAAAIDSKAQLRRFMRYNDWRNDPLCAAGYGGPEEARSPENAIAARNDLIPSDGTTKAQRAERGVHGNTDGKLASRDDVLAMRFEFVVGPTHDDQPPFAWIGEWETLPHEGHPTVFNFTWQMVDLLPPARVEPPRAAAAAADLLLV